MTLISTVANTTLLFLLPPPPHLRRGERRPLFPAFFSASFSPPSLSSAGFDRMRSNEARDEGGLSGGVAEPLLLLPIPLPLPLLARGGVPPFLLTLVVLLRFSMVVLPGLAFVLPSLPREDPSCRALIPSSKPSTDAGKLALLIKLLLLSGDPCPPSFFTGDSGMGEVEAEAREGGAPTSPSPPPLLCPSLLLLSSLSAALRAASIVASCAAI
eukprot:CAMPEP_0113907736 /NCGR_PEP_ID=MMETSP0780_2-20120614/25686_1 /TAXON_ID=652834 /ORGANISM="Palpitomonas bilix" /LENGTH=212 /DNA_ID=CAMNT_0000902915 /DNA_START=102 /DNA_END=740 /DNA_ORIENTATION=+ /assembly_acc=CAM_ASM_000599